MYLKENRLNPIVGCLMVKMPGNYSKVLLKHGQRLVKDEHLYKAADDIYERETEPHITIRHGFKPDLDEQTIKELFKNISPFRVSITGVSMFQGENFNVVKYNVQSDVLKELNSRCLEFAGEDSHPVYVPHITIAYVIKDSPAIEHRLNLRNEIVIDEVIYCGADKKRLEFSLREI